MIFSLNDSCQRRREQDDEADKLIWNDEFEYLVD